MSSKPTIVSVSKHGQATIPKHFREKLGIDAPGKVRFRETEDGEIVVERVAEPAEMRGFARRRGEPTTDESATELLREKRAQERRERDEQFEAGEEGEE
jgi:AbrB family looped-hinge helix DNA binding protein